LQQHIAEHDDIATPIPSVANRIGRNYPGFLFTLAQFLMASIFADVVAALRRSLPALSALADLHHRNTHFDMRNNILHA
jgi:hypothetical protein